VELSPEQRNLLEGGQGSALSRFMRWLVDWGQAMGARRLVPVENVHLSGISPPAIGREAPSDQSYDEAMSDAVLYCSSPARCTATCANADVALGLPLADYGAEADRLRQTIERQLELARKAGIALTWTCTPFLVGNLPARGEICAWTESSAIVFINSVLGARTTRHGTESAVAAAATGYVPEFGALLPEGRRGELLVDVQVPLANPSDWGALGYFTGEKAGLRNPLFLGPRRMGLSEAKQVSSALATTGGVTMFHLAGVTPEAQTLEQALGGQDPGRLERWSFGSEELEATYARLREFGPGPVDYVVLGCPHLSLQEVVQIVRALDGRRISPHVRLELWTPHALRAEAQRLGFLQELESCGAVLLADSCPAVCAPVRGGLRVLTDSFKQAHYLRAAIGAQVAVDATEACLEAAVRGSWQP
jgi:predicted aconitase